MNILDLKKNILEDNDKEADILRDELKEKGLYYINIMSSPGSGKTSTILRLIEGLKDSLKIGVLEADIDSDVDAITVEKTGTKAIQLHTGGMCHLDADMSRQALGGLDASGLDLVILENVGNLVCPAEFDTGSHMDLVILSVPEGDDKPLKYPLVFTKCQAVIINKIDSMPVFDFSIDNVEKYVRELNPDARIFPISARTGEGCEELCQWLLERIGVRHE